MDLAKGVTKEAILQKKLGSILLQSRELLSANDDEFDERIDSSVPVLNISTCSEDLETQLLEKYPTENDLIETEQLQTESLKKNPTQMEPMVTERQGESNKENMQQSQNAKNLNPQSTDSSNKEDRDVDAGRPKRRHSMQIDRYTHVNDKVMQLI